MYGQTSSANDRMAWWREARFGMFIHWGVYAVPAGIYKGQKISVRFHRVFVNNTASFM